MVSRIKKFRDKTSKALYKLYTPQEHHPKAKIFQKEQFKPGDMTIRFKQRKKPKQMLSIEEIMEKEEAKKKAKEAKKKSKKRKREYRNKTRKGKKQFLRRRKRKSKNGGRRRKRKRKRTKKKRR